MAVRALEGDWEFVSDKVRGLAIIPMKTHYSLKDLYTYMRIIYGPYEFCLQDSLIYRVMTL